MTLAVCATAALGAALGCGPRPANRALKEARAAYAEAQQSRDLRTRAPVAMHEAAQSLERAEVAFGDGEDDRNVTTFAYVTQRRLDVAREVAGTKQAEEERSQLATATPASALPSAEFASGRADLGPTARHQLATAACVLRRQPKREALIEGHTDSTGSDAVNERLAQRRADTVRNYLIAQGVDAGRVTARGFGPSYPVASNRTAAGRQQNRRADVFLEPPEVSAAEPATRSAGPATAGAAATGGHAAGAAGAGTSAEAGATSGVGKKASPSPTTEPR
ncbi:MAG TPA: OmpA family protein [Candidatus Binatia bacterium]|nr:OmpA family protein [Candidatus Binatia bacterium]